MKLTIITINLNNLDGLIKTVNSVLEQTIRDFEFVIVDGSSTDGSVGFIQDTADRFPGLIWISEPDTGIFNDMNKGIRLSHGDYLLFLNGGDTLASKDILLRAFESFPTTDIVNARCNVVDEGRIVWTSPFLPVITLKTLYSVGIPHQSSFIKRELFQRFGFYNEGYKYNADIAFWYKTILFGGATTSALDLILTNYDRNGISSTDSKTELYTSEMNEILSEGILPRIIPDYKGWKEYRDKMREYEWISSSPFTRSLLKILSKIQKHTR